MKLNEQTIVKPLPNNEVIKKREEYWRIEFPENFKTFIKTYNGCKPLDYSGTFSADNQHEYIIDRFLCLLDSPAENEYGDYDINVLLSANIEYFNSNEDIYGTEIVPIAALFAGDFLCLDFRGNNREPKVVVWNHEESDEFEPVFYHVANSFDEFIEIVK